MFSVIIQCEHFWPQIPVSGTFEMTLRKLLCRLREAHNVMIADSAFTYTSYTVCSFFYGLTPYSDYS